MKMEAALMRTGSGPTHSYLLPGSPRVSMPLRHDSFTGGEKLDFPASLHLERHNSRRRITREISDPEMLTRSGFTGSRSQTFTAYIPEAEESLSELESGEDVVGRIGSLKFAEKWFDQTTFPSESRIAVKELEFPGVGSGSGRDRDGFGTGGSSGGSNNENSDRSKIGAHYQQMLKLNPSDPLLLRNYAKFLHEVEGDTVKAEEYYGRAILANPGDGEVLSLYGRLIWDTQRDGERATSYFNQAAAASPDDCLVMGSYAQFMWEAEEDDDEEHEYATEVLVSAAAPMVSAF